MRHWPRWAAAEEQGDIRVARYLRGRMRRIVEHRQRKTLLQGLRERLGQHRPAADDEGHPDAVAANDLQHRPEDFLFGTHAERLQQQFDRRAEQFLPQQGVGGAVKQVGTEQSHCLQLIEQGQCPGGLVFLQVRLAQIPIDLRQLVALAALGGFFVAGYRIPPASHAKQDRCGVVEGLAVQRAMAQVLKHLGHCRFVAARLGQRRCVVVQFCKLLRIHSDTPMLKNKDNHSRTDSVQIACLYRKTALLGLQNVFWGDWYCGCQVFRRPALTAGTVFSHQRSIAASTGFSQTSQGVR